MQDRNQVNNDILGQIRSQNDSSEPTTEELRSLFSCIDNTTLNSDDTQSSVMSFCLKTKAMYDENNVSPAAVCVYPTFVALAKGVFENTPIHVASVAGGFPSGQTSIEVKKIEIRYALDQGADEIDFVINRGCFLEGNQSVLCDEVRAAKELCGEKLLKVILETGELQTPENIYNAAMLAIKSGADFIKTSTGKIATGATPEAAMAMLMAIKDFELKNKKKVGFKAAGGISTIQDALLYYRMAKKIAYNQKIDNHNFRIGTSRLTASILKKLTE